MKQVFWLLLVAVAITASSCTKEGCTDQDALNYDEEADENDGSCTYSANAVLYYDQTMSTLLVLAGHTSLTFRMDGIIIGSTATSQFWNGAPDCGSAGSNSYTKNLGVQKTGVASYQVTNEFGQVLWQGNVTLTANTCTPLELVL